MPFTILTEPDPRDVQELDERLYAFNQAATGIGDGALLTILERDADGTLVAGLHGWTWGDACEIRTLWIAEPMRRRGLGSRMLAAAEAEARRRGARHVILSSQSFQAPDFYRRHGYETLFVVDGHPSPHAQHFLRKQLC
jgi:N-acetylglutamate synthase-like GNAT family acetyltransferase